MPSEKQTGQEESDNNLSDQMYKLEVTFQGVYRFLSANFRKRIAHFVRSADDIIWSAYLRPNNVGIVGKS